MALYRPPRPPARPGLVPDRLRARLLVSINRPSFTGVKYIETARCARLIKKSKNEAVTVDGWRKMFSDIN
jgi:hypothetical protein